MVSQLPSHAGSLQAPIDSAFFADRILRLETEVEKDIRLMRAERKLQIQRLSVCLLTGTLSQYHPGRGREWQMVVPRGS